MELLWICYKLRQAEKTYGNYGSYNNRNTVRYWQTKLDEKMAIIGIDENTDFKNDEIKFTTE